MNDSVSPPTCGENYNGNPVIITGCSKYKEYITGTPNSVCETCKNGYYSDSASTCATVATVLDNCVEYDDT